MADITVTFPDAQYEDVIVSSFGGIPEIKCLDHGFVRLVDCMPRLVPKGSTADFAVVQAARVSYGAGTKQVTEDRGLARYLLRHSHTSPSEMVVFKFHISMPIFVARQHIRHRMSSTNEESGRYSVLTSKFYKPHRDNVRKQSVRNKQVSEGQVEDMTADEFLKYLDEMCDANYAKYQEFLGKGIGKEQARIVLPLNLYTSFYWKIDLHNLMHYLALRCDKHAQQEIQVYAHAVKQLLEKIVPWSMEAWEDYHPMRGALKLTRLEVEAIKRGKVERYLYGEEDPHFAVRQIQSDNKREQEEWAEKARKLGFVLESE